MPNIIMVQRFSAEAVEDVCRRNKLFTLGDNTDFSEMLAEVSSSEVSTEEIFNISKMIARFSVGWNVLDIMYLPEEDKMLEYFKEFVNLITGKGRKS